MLMLPDYRWHEKFTPVLPCVTLPPFYPDPKSGVNFPYTFSDANPYLETIDVTKAAKAARKLLSRQHQDAIDSEVTTDEHPIRNWFRRASGDFDSTTQIPPPSSGVAGGFASLVSGLVQKMREERAAVGGTNEHPLLALGEKAKSPSFGASETTFESNSEKTAVGASSPALVPAVVPPIAAVTEEVTDEPTSNIAARRHQDNLAVSTTPNSAAMVDQVPLHLAPSIAGTPSPSEPDGESFPRSLYSTRTDAPPRPTWTLRRAWQLPTLQHVP